jgi:hypothetical protein
LTPVLTFFLSITLFFVTLVFAITAPLLASGLRCGIGCAAQAQDRHSDQTYSEQR